MTTSSLPTCLFLFASCVAYCFAETALDHLNADPNFSTLATLVTASSAAKALLSGPGPVTLFAPVNSAFSSGYMTGYKVKFLLDPKNIATLEKVLAYHGTFHL